MNKINKKIDEFKKNFKSRTMYWRKDAFCYLIYCLAMNGEILLPPKIPKSIKYRGIIHKFIHTYPLDI